MKNLPQFLPPYRMLDLQQPLKVIAVKQSARGTQNQRWSNLEQQYPLFDGSQICAQTDPDLWFPTSEKQTGRLAKSLCRTCPWVTSCLDYALRHEVVGIWGGKTERERMQLRKINNIMVQPLYSYALFAPSLRGKGMTGRYNEETDEVNDD